MTSVYFPHVPHEFLQGAGLNKKNAPATAYLAADELLLHKTTPKKYVRDGITD